MGGTRDGQAISAGHGGTARCSVSHRDRRIRRRQRRVGRGTSTPLLLAAAQKAAEIPPTKPCFLPLRTADQPAMPLTPWWFWPCREESPVLGDASLEVAINFIKELVASSRACVAMKAVRDWMRECVAAKRPLPLVTPQPSASARLHNDPKRLPGVRQTQTCAWSVRQCWHSLW